MTPPESASKGRRADLTRDLVDFFQAAAGDGLKVAPDTPLLQWGILDSVRILEVAELLRAKAGYRLDASALRKENFKDVRSIVRLVDAGASVKPARRKGA